MLGEGEFCEDCLYWVSDDGVFGACHRYAPKPSLRYAGSLVTCEDVVWPLVKQDNWCGEGEPASP